jgi:hypothetical protein
MMVVYGGQQITSLLKESANELYPVEAILYTHTHTHIIFVYDPH